MATLVVPLRKAGVEIKPLTFRVWQWLKDNGPHNCNQVSDALGEKRNNTSSTLGQLVDRGMVIAKRSADKLDKHPKYVYTTAPKMKSFELWPVTKEAKERLRLKRVGFSPAPVADKPLFVEAGIAHLAPAVQVVVEPVIPTHILDTMSVRDAYALYLELRTMFKKD